jgi:hypothetical protein
VITKKTVREIIAKKMNLRMVLIILGYLVLKFAVIFSRYPGYPISS